MFVHNLNDANKSNKKTIITIGNYDGFHLGHRFLIDKLNKLSLAHNLKSVLVTFNPHTKNIISNKNFKVLTTFNDKVHLAQFLSIDIICEVSFNKNVKNKSYEDFINMIIDKYNPSIVLFGYDNKIGKNQKGDFEVITKYLKKSNIKVDNCEAYYNESNKKVTTTAIKENILNYNIEEANKLLGRNYSLKGKVVKGENRGKSLGYPTANIEIMSFEQLVPPNGVYSVTLTANDVKYKSICNIGFCPTIKVNSSKITLEVHVINKEINLYDKNVVVEFISFIRKEFKFNNENDLKNQIMKDIVQVIWKGKIVTDKVIEKYGKNKSDSGSTEAQIALFTGRINQLNEHLKVNKKDNSSRRGLMIMVSKRRKLLKYLQRNDIKSYTGLIKKLNIRK